MTRLLILAAAAVVLVGAGAYWQLSRPDTLPGLSPVGTAQAQSADAADAGSVEDITLGDPDAPVTMVEYASYTCPHCKTFHSGPFKQLKADYIDTGEINFVYREVFFDRFGLWAAMVARCGGEDRYFGIADLIYEQQSEWTAGGDPAMVADNLRRIGRTAGLSDDQVNACLQDGEKAQAMVEEARLKAAKTKASVQDIEKEIPEEYRDHSSLNKHVSDLKQTIEGEACAVKLIPVLNVVGMVR